MTTAWPYQGYFKASEEAPSTFFQAHFHFSYKYNIHFCIVLDSFLHLPLQKNIARFCPCVFTASPPGKWNKYAVSWKRAICMFGVEGNTPQAHCWGLCLPLCVTQVLTAVGSYGMLLLGPCSSECSDKPGPCKGIEESACFLWYESLRLVSSSTREIITQNNL